MTTRTYSAQGFKQALEGVAPPTIGLIAIETHIAEKLHAYTMPRVRVNTRVRGLPDIALLATARALDAARLIAALEQTFTSRATHTLPDKFPDPVLEWGGQAALGDAPGGHQRGAFVHRTGVGGQD